LFEYGDIVAAGELPHTLRHTPNVRTVFYDPIIAIDDTHHRAQYTGVALRPE
jgi:hypothetical protein